MLPADWAKVEAQLVERGARLWLALEDDRGIVGLTRADYVFTPNPTRLLHAPGG